jgi:hypothetical protein
VLSSLVSEKIVATGEPFEVVASTGLAVKRILGCSMLDVLLLVAMQVLWVQEAFVADATLVWSLKATKMGLTMATGRMLVRVTTRSNTVGLAQPHLSCVLEGVKD